MAVAATTVVLAVFVAFRELNVPFKKVVGVLDFGTGMGGVDASPLIRSKDPFVGTS
jgi:hypothetical protein